MPRKVPDACIFCDQVPCACNGTSKTARVAKAVTSSADTQVPSLPSRSSHLDKMKAAAAAAHVAAAPPAESLPQLPSPASDEAVLWAAIRALKPVLHEQELQTYSMILTSTPTAEERAAVWRARRETQCDVPL